MIKRIYGAIIWLQLRYLELAQDRFLQDGLDEWWSRVEVKDVTTTLRPNLDFAKLMLNVSNSFIELLLLSRSPMLREIGQD